MYTRNLLISLLLLLFAACNGAGVEDVDTLGGGEDMAWGFDPLGEDGTGPGGQDGLFSDLLPGNDLGAGDGYGPDQAVPVDGETPGCEAESGCDGDPCSENADCISGLCIAHMGDFICAQLCDEECPTGFTCKQVATGGPDAIFACVSDFSHLCLPCEGKSDCSDGYQQNACVTFGQEGAFCGASCADGGACPEGFDCVESETTEAGLSMQCVPTGGALCPCSNTAAALGLSTPCAATTELGTCWGDRPCGPDGLGDCDAPAPAAETCDGEDEDCDGDVDEETCDDLNPCTKDACLGAGGCDHEPQDGGPCDDEDPCTFGDHCDTGMCVGSVVNCTDDTCTPIGGCQNIPNNNPCNDGDPCTTTDLCQASACVGFGALTCNDGNLCTNDSCQAGVGCTFPAITPCCGNGAVEFGEDCDDGNQSSGDGCDASCQDEGGGPGAFKGYTTFNHNVCEQTFDMTDAAMDQACKNAYGGAASAATVLDLVDGLITGLPGYNNSGDWVMFKCPFCAGSTNYWNCGGQSETCRKGVNGGAAWPTSVNSGWNQNMCNATRTAVCVQ